jgi:hypothetical protein
MGSTCVDIDSCGSETPSPVESKIHIQLFMLTDTYYMVKFSTIQSIASRPQRANYTLSVIFVLFVCYIAHRENGSIGFDDLFSNDASS